MNAPGLPFLKPQEAAFSHCQFSNWLAISELPTIVLSLRQDHNHSHHSQLVVEHAYVRISSGSSEGHAEAGGA